MSYKNNFDLQRWLHDQVIFKETFRKVTFCIDSSGVWMQGDLKIQTETGREIGPFTLRVVFTDKYFMGIRPPSTYLISHREKWKPYGDAHIEKSWKLCLFLYFESNINFNEYESFSMYLKSLSSFMVDQWLYQKEVQEIGYKNAKWPGPQRMHNVEGYVEGILKNLKSNKKQCPCGSKKKFLNCCQILIDKHVERMIKNV